MASPFPGMDPYLEHPAYWPDFHARFITYGCDALAERLPPDYVAHIDERIRLVEVAAEKSTRTRPDLTISRGSSGRPPAWAAAPAGLATIEPVTASYAVAEEVRETRIEILHHPDHTLVAVVELLSPENKRGTGHAQYEAKRLAILAQQVHLIEIDLLRGGKRPSMSQPLPAGDYFALIGHCEQRPECQIFAWTVGQVLPTIPIPLLSSDLPVWLNLGELLTAAYERGHYLRWIDYSGTLSAPWDPDDLEWIRKQVEKSEPS
jgi:hypothetical protein